MPLRNLGLLSLLLLAPAACRDAAVDGAPYVPVDAGADGGFDTSIFETDTDATATDDPGTESETDTVPVDDGPGLACPEGSLDLFDDTYAPVRGGQGEVRLRVTNFSYFRCPHCAHYHALVEELLARRADLADEVEFRFHHFPFSDDASWELHAAVVAAQLQGEDAFWAMHDYLFDSLNATSPYTVPISELVTFADEELGLDMEKYETDRLSEEVRGFLQWDRQQGDDAGVTGTPSVFVCGEKISWPDLEVVLDEILADDL